MHVLALIPARRGSKSVPHKNIRLIAGKPLLAYSIEHALASRLITRSIVSTDSPEYAKIAREYGAETPFLRPPEISGDLSTDLEAFVHALNWLKENEGYVPEICVHLRPTHPIRRPGDIDNMIRILLDDPSLHSARSVAAAPCTPFKMWFRGEDGLLSPVTESHLNDPHNLPRQLLPQSYAQNASIDVVRTGVITELHSMTGQRIYGYVMQENLDIDTDAEFNEVAKRLEACTGPKTFCIDFDGVIAGIVPDLRYDLAEPIRETIEAINRLCDLGHRIIIFTARGSATGRDWTEVTRNQISQWGLKHHELIFGKPAADYYIDDKMLAPEQLEAFVSALDICALERRLDSD